MTVPPFSSFEVFLYESLTLRSNAAYRQDVDLLMQYEADAQADGRNDWVRSFEPGDRPYQAAQSIIATWELICRIARTHYTDRLDEFHATMLPLGPIYVWLRPAIDAIDDVHPDGASYAGHFKALGEQALARYQGITGIDPVQLTSATGRQRTEAYRSAWKQLRPLTHFG